MFRLDYAQFLELELFTRFGGAPGCARAAADRARRAVCVHCWCNRDSRRCGWPDEVALALALREGVLDGGARRVDRRVAAGAAGLARSARRAGGGGDPTRRPDGHDGHGGVARGDSGAGGGACRARWTSFRHASDTPGSEGATRPGRPGSSSEPGGRAGLGRAGRSGRRAGWRQWLRTSPRSARASEACGNWMR